MNAAAARTVHEKSAFSPEERYFQNVQSCKGPASLTDRRATNRRATFRYTGFPLRARASDSKCGPAGK